MYIVVEAKEHFLPFPFVYLIMSFIVTCNAVRSMREISEGW
jgi:hypothetical protein